MAMHLFLQVREQERPSAARIFAKESALLQMISEIDQHQIQELMRCVR
jgi:hypothetical protein